MFAKNISSHRFSNIYCGTSLLPYVEPSYFHSFISLRLSLYFSSLLFNLSWSIDLLLYLFSSLSCYTSLFSLTSYSISLPSHQFISLYQVQKLFLTGFLRQSELGLYAPIWKNSIINEKIKLWPYRHIYWKTYAKWQWQQTLENMIVIERKKENFYERGRGNKETCVKKVMKLLKKDNQSSQGSK